jgi:hypothetical protein
VREKEKIDTHKARDRGKKMRQTPTHKARERERETEKMQTEKKRNKPGLTFSARMLAQHIFVCH